MTQEEALNYLKMYAYGYTLDGEYHTAHSFDLTKETSDILMKMCENYIHKEVSAYEIESKGSIVHIVDHEKLCDKIDKYEYDLRSFEYWEDIMKNIKHDILDAINSCIIDVHQDSKRDEWKRLNNGPDHPEAICPKCGREVVYQVINNHWAFERYCPHCGTRLYGSKLDL